MMLRAVLCGGVWNGFLLGQTKKEEVPCRFFGGKDGDGHFFGNVPFPPPLLPPSLTILHVRELCEFLCLTSLDRNNWPRCFQWHG